MTVHDLWTLDTLVEAYKRHQRRTRRLRDRTLLRRGSVGGQFQVNTPSSYYQAGGQIAIDAEDRFVVVWGQGMIRGQRFAMNLIFADSFESGDTSAWSGTVP